MYFAQQPLEVAKAARAAGFGEAVVAADVAARVVGLPQHHRDPFDRLLVALALALELPVHLFTADAVLLRYPALVRFLG